MSDIADMLVAANAARAHAHAPYSGFAVGACLAGKSGRLYAGCNVENAAYPQGQCAEASAIGVIMGAFGAAGFLVRMLIPPLTARWGERAMLAGALALACMFFVAIPLTANPWLLGAVSFIVGLGMGCGQPLSMILSFNAAPLGRSAEAIAMRMAVSYGAHVIIPPVFGALGTAMGLAPVFWICAAFMGAGAALNRKGAVQSETKQEAG